MNNLLSIFIPTYNRCNVLDTVLDRVISAVKEYDVCVQVYDNCSLDKTENIVCAKQKLYPYIFYCKNLLIKKALNVKICLQTALKFIIEIE